MELMTGNSDPSMQHTVPKVANSGIALKETVLSRCVETQPETSAGRSVRTLLDRCCTARAATPVPPATDARLSCVLTQQFQALRATDKVVNQQPKNASYVYFSLGVFWQLLALLLDKAPRRVSNSFWKTVGCSAGLSGSVVGHGGSLIFISQ